MTVKEGIEDDISDNPGIPVVHLISVECSNGHSITTNLNQTENGSNTPNSSVLNDKMIYAGDNLSYQKCISQDKSIENNLTLMPKRKKIQSGYALCSKVLVIFAVCCIIGCYLIPVILYYVSQTGGSTETDPEFSHEKNTSTAKVCCKLNV